MRDTNQSLMSNLIFQDGSNNDSLLGDFAAERRSKSSLGENNGNSKLRNKILNKNNQTNPANN